MNHERLESSRDVWSDLETAAFSKLILANLNLLQKPGPGRDRALDATERIFGRNTPGAF